MVVVRFILAQRATGVSPSTPPLRGQAVCTRLAPLFLDVYI
jgi:hypothetical protein